MEILLVKPKAVLGPVLGLEAFQRLEPVELGYLAAAVPRRHAVRVLDLRLQRRPWRALDRALAARPPDLVGITGYTHESSMVKEIARRLRERSPRTTVVVGGHHATVAADDYDLPSIDAIVRGEGCAAFAEIVARVEARKPIEGIPHVTGTGERFDPEAIRTWPRFPDPATLPAPRRDLWDPRSYRAVWVCENASPFQPLFPPVSLVRSSWGCRMKCTFCVVPHLCGGEHRPRPAELVADEIAALPTDHVYFSDDENFIDEAYAYELAEELARRDVRKRYFAWTRSTTVNRSPELLRRWREIGLDGAFLGFEYADDRHLKRVQKGGTVAANERALDRLRAVGVAVHAAFMVDPEFDEPEFDALANYIRGMPPAQCSLTVRTPSPGTDDYREMRPAMWVERPYDLHDCMHPLVPTALPLRRFADRLARQASDGVAKTPLRAQHRPLRPRDLWRVTWAQRRYVHGYRTLYRDYPREMWDR